MEAGLVNTLNLEFYVHGAVMFSLWSVCTLLKVQSVMKHFYWVVCSETGMLMF